MVVENMPILCVDMIVTMGKTVLLVKRDNEPLKGEWWVPGGRVLKGETLTDAVHRKMKEEVGLEVDIHEFVGLYEGFFDKSAHGVPTHTVSAVFVVRPISTDVELDNQSSNYTWTSGGLPPKFENGITKW